MSDTITGAPSLESLSARATPGRLDLQSLDLDCHGVPLIAVPDDIPVGGTPTNGLVAIATLLPSECPIDHIGPDPRRAQANAAYLARLWNDYRASRLHTSEALAQAVAAAREETGWRPIETAPCDPMVDYDFDLPGNADEGLGYATDTDMGVIAFLVWWTRTGPGRSKVTHWRPLPAPPTPAQTDTAPGGRADG